MSRIGRLPIPVPSGVDIKIDGQDVTVKGPKGELKHTVAEPIEVGPGGRHGQGRPAPATRGPIRALHGLTRTLINNMVVGVTAGLQQDAGDRRRRLPRPGQGQATSSSRSASATRSRWTPPEGITFRVERPTQFVVEGIDKQKVGEVAANIRKLRKPDPYKGKGVRYQGEQIRRKVGKAGK